MDGERERELRSVRRFLLQYNNSEVYESTLPRYLGKVRYMRYMYIAEGYLYADLVAARPKCAQTSNTLQARKSQTAKTVRIASSSTIKQSDMQLINISRSIQALPRKGAKVEEIQYLLTRHLRATATHIQIFDTIFQFGAW